jgi:hypothetical protein
MSPKLSVLFFSLAFLSNGYSQTPAPTSNPAVRESAPGPDAPGRAASPQVPAPAPDAAVAAQPVMDVLSSLARWDQNGRDPGQKVGFELPESAVNAYAAYILRERPRPGVRSAHLTLLPGNQITVETEIDFDTVAGWNVWAPPQVLKALLNGRKSLRMTFEFDARNGMVTFKWKEIVGPDNKAIRSSVLAGFLEVLGAHQPESYDMTKPIPLPFGLQRIWTVKQLIGGEN